MTTAESLFLLFTLIIGTIALGAVLATVFTGRRQDTRRDVGFDLVLARLNGQENSPKKLWPPAS